MKKEYPIVAVTGLGRSGTSLMMRMLYAGGMNVFAEEYRTFEFNDCDKLERIIDHCTGKAVKMMCPHWWKPPTGYVYKFIWMKRDFKEQAKSQAKLQKYGKTFTGHVLPERKVTRQHIRQYVKLFKKETEVALALLQSYPDSEVIKINFEDLIKDPLTQAKRVREFVGQMDCMVTFDGCLNINTMIKPVIQRDTKCLEGFLEDGYSSEQAT